MRKMRAFVSVTDKRNLGLLKRWTDAGHEIVSTGGTANKFTELGIPCTQVGDVTGFPEILDGRVKSMHPLITGGMLANTKLAKHVEQMTEHKIVPFDLVIVNLYDFFKNPGIENIDVGGPTALRSAAKNGGCVTVIMRPEDYELILDYLLVDGSVPRKVRDRLACEVFEATAQYDKAISEWMRAKFAKDESLFETTSTAAH